MTTTTIYLARHGETEWNLQGRFQGTQDSPLTARGIAQAEQLARELSAEPLDAVLSSDLGRALVTAQTVAAPHGVEVTTLAGLREIDTGAWTGLNRTEIAEQWPDQLERWRKGPATVQIPGGETFQQVQQRALAALAESLQPLAGARLAVITHGTLLETLLATALNLDLSALWLRLAWHCQAHTLQYADGRLQVVQLGAQETRPDAGADLAVGKEEPGRQR